MRATFDKAKGIKTAITAAAKVCGDRGFPFVSFDNVDGCMQVTCGNTELRVSLKIEPDSYDSGSVASVTVNLVPLSNLFKTIKANASITLTIGSESLMVECAGTKVEIPATNDGRELPIPFKNLESGEFDANSLIDAINKVAYAMPADDSRYYLAGILFKKSSTSSTVRVVATDGHRLAATDLSDSGAFESGLTVPRDTIKVMQSIWPICAHKATIERGDDYSCVIDIDGGNMRLWSKTIAGEYPDYERVIPQKSATPVAFEQTAMLERLKQAFEQIKLQAAAYDDSGYANSIGLCIGRGMMVLQPSVVVPTTKPIDPAWAAETAVDPKYLRDTVCALSGGGVINFEQDCKAPVRIDDDDGQSVHVLSPIDVDIRVVMPDQVTPAPKPVTVVQDAPSSDSDAAPGLPVNASTGKAYQEGNIDRLLLAGDVLPVATHRWATFKQWLDLERCVMKGQKGTPIKVYRKALTDEDGNPVDPDDPRANKRTVVKTAYVFNESQTKPLEVSEKDAA
ncbi:MAG: ArdC-like ssDNA-binding domain-containing protein [Pseudomonadota bacterium]